MMHQDTGRQEGERERDRPSLCQGAFHETDSVSKT